LSKVQLKGAILLASIKRVNGLKICYMEKADYLHLTVWLFLNMSIRVSSRGVSTTVRDNSHGPMALYMLASSKKAGERGKVL
jgi:hypothetical protein